MGSAARCVSDLEPGEDLMRKQAFRLYTELVAMMKIPCEGGAWDIKCPMCPAHHVSGECGIAILRRTVWGMRFMRENPLRRPVEL